MTWKLITAERFYEMLNILPPAVETDIGFLVGEPVSDRLCMVTGDYRATYAPFVEFAGRYYEGEPMTRAEFRALRVYDVICAAHAQEDLTKVPLFPQSDPGDETEARP